MCRKKFIIILFIILNIFIFFPIKIYAEESPIEIKDGAKINENTVITNYNNADIYVETKKIEIENFETIVNGKNVYRKYVLLYDLVDKIPDISYQYSKSDKILTLKRKYDKTINQKNVYYNTQHDINKNTFLSVLFIDEEDKILFGDNSSGQIFTADTETLFINDKIYVSLRFITEALGAEVTHKIRDKVENGQKKESVSIDFYNSDNYAKFVNLSWKNEYNTIVTQNDIENHSKTGYCFLPNFSYTYHNGEKITSINNIYSKIYANENHFKWNINDKKLCSITNSSKTLTNTSVIIKYRGVPVVLNIDNLGISKYCKREELVKTDSCNNTDNCVNNPKCGIIAGDYYCCQEKVEESKTEDGIFGNYVQKAKETVKNMTLDEKIGQLLLVGVTSADQTNTIKTYNFGGCLLFQNSFSNKTKDQVKTMINNYQNASKIPLLIAADEEGGTVTRISKNKNLVSSPFQSPRDLYNSGGLNAIKQDTITKNNILSSLGINLNLAPVVDIATSSNDFMYKRSLGQNTEITSEFAKLVIETSKSSSVSYTLKHFPGYGNNADTHTGLAIDNRSLSDIKSRDIPPFKAGIDAGAEAILVSHNVINSIDNGISASLSSKVINILKNDLNFTGVIITDDLTMGGTKSNKSTSKYVQALLAGNDLLIVQDYSTAIKDIKNDINNGTISHDIINEHVTKIISWKYYKKLLK